MSIAQLRERDADGLSEPLRSASAESLPRRNYPTFALVPLGTTLGAEVAGLALAERLSDPAVRAELRQALLDWKVLFFRRQQLTTEEYLAFGALWGEPYAHPFTPASVEQSKVAVFSKGRHARGYENAWHSDDPWMGLPTAITILRSRILPEVGGDTLWADMAAAYDDLPEDLKQRLEGLLAENAHPVYYNGFNNERAAGSADEFAVRREMYPPVNHPVVRTHPETGRRSIYVSAESTTRIVGVTDAESESILANLVKRAAVPEYQVRFKWTEDTIAVWDNRVLQHYAPSDYWPLERRMERIIIRGDRPI